MAKKNIKKNLVKKNGVDATVTIRVTVGTADKLKKLGTMDDTYDSVIQRLLDIAEKKN